MQKTTTTSTRTDGEERHWKEDANRFGSRVKQRLDSSFQFFPPFRANSSAHPLKDGLSVEHVSARNFMIFSSFLFPGCKIITYSGESGKCIAVIRRDDEMFDHHLNSSSPGLTLIIERVRHAHIHTDIFVLLSDHEA